MSWNGEPTCIGRSDAPPVRLGTGATRREIAGGHGRVHSGSILPSTDPGRQQAIRRGRAVDGGDATSALDDDRPVHVGMDVTHEEVLARILGRHLDLEGLALVDGIAGGDLVSTLLGVDRYVVRRRVVVREADRERRAGRCLDDARVERKVLCASADTTPSTTATVPPPALSLPSPPESAGVLHAASTAKSGIARESAPPRRSMMRREVTEVGVLSKETSGRCGAAHSRRDVRRSPGSRPCRLPRCGPASVPGRG